MDYLVMNGLQSLNDSDGARLAQLRCLARTYKKHGKFEQALELLRSLLEGEERLFGLNSHEAAVTLCLTADVQYELGKKRAARGLYRQAVTIWKRLKKLEVLTPEQCVYFLDTVSNLPAGALDVPPTLGI